MGFTNSFVKLGSNLSEIEASHSAAVKAVEAEKKKDLENRRKGTGTKAQAATPTKRGPEIKDGKPVFGTSAAEPLTLFDSREPGEPAAHGDQIVAPQGPPDTAESGSAIGTHQNTDTRQEEEEEEEGEVA